MKWRVFLTPKVQEVLRTFPPEIKTYLRASLEEIAKDPSVGKVLKDELAGFRSFRARRFRIVYKINRHTITVLVIGIGHRRDIYEEVSLEIRTKK